MSRHGVVAGVLLAIVLAGRAAADTPKLIGFVDNRVQFAVQRAVMGAGVRLARPACQKVLSDFTDPSGQPLSTSLHASERSISEAFGLLRFVDGSTAPQCLKSPRVAFTVPGSWVVHVCGRQFRDRDRVFIEMIVIHEFLHALGLGESPPSSLAITEQVAARCG